jgi:hypothetical protein
MNEPTGISCASTTKRRGRPLAAKTIAIRTAVHELAEQFEVMTVRQIFYALTVRGIVPKDENAGYRPVQTQVLKLRREGSLPWSFIADATRWQRKPQSYDRAEDALMVTARAYRRNLWRAQAVRVEVWLEKDALAGVVMEATEKWDVPLMVSRGTSSATFLHEAAQAASAAWYDAGISTMVLALYDRDAAGRRAARTVEQGLVEFAPGVPIEFSLLAVTDYQVGAWQLPSRPAKGSDPEAAKFTGPAVELDAIPPRSTDRPRRQRDRRMRRPAGVGEGASDRAERADTPQKAGDQGCQRMHGCQPRKRVISSQQVSGRAKKRRRGPGNEPGPRRDNGIPLTRSRSDKRRRDLHLTRHTKRPPTSDGSGARKESMKTYWVNTFGVIHVEADSEEQALDAAHGYACELMETDVPGRPRLTLLSVDGEDAGIWNADPLTRLDEFASVDGCAGQRRKEAPGGV